MSMTSTLLESFAKHPQSRTFIPVVDMHLHFVDFLQQTDGFHTKTHPKTGEKVVGLLESMEEGYIQKNVVFGLPVKKKWEFFEPVKPHYYLDDDSKAIYWPSTDEIVASHYLGLSEEESHRIAPTLVGFDPTDMCAIDYVEEMFEKYPFWAGIGEVLLRHDDLTNMTLDEVPRANHPALKAIYEFCIKKELPICLHQNSTSVASDLSAETAGPYIYLHELREVLETHGDDLCLIWAHCGVSRRVNHVEYHTMVREALLEHKNLHVDLSWIVYDDTICEPRKEDTDPHIPKTEWIRLCEDFCDRIMIGSDLCGHFSTHGKTIARYNTLLETLSEKARLNIARHNAERLYFKK